MFSAPPSDPSGDLIALFPGFAGQQHRARILECHQPGREVLIETQCGVIGVEGGYRIESAYAVGGNCYRLNVRTDKGAIYRGLFPQNVKPRGWLAFMDFECALDAALRAAQFRGDRSCADACWQWFCSRPWL